MSLWVSCSHYAPPQTAPPPTDVKLVGKVIDGVLTFEPGVDPKGKYPVVTRAFVYYCYFLMWETMEQKLEIEKLRARIK